MSGDLGYHRNWATHVENGSYLNLSVLDVLNIANVLNVPPQYLLLGDTKAGIHREVRNLGDFQRIFANDRLMAETLHSVWRAIQKARKERPRASASKSTSTE